MLLRFGREIAEGLNTCCHSMKRATRGAALLASYQAWDLTDGLDDFLKDDFVAVPAERSDFLAGGHLNVGSSESRLGGTQDAIAQTEGGSQSFRGEQVDALLPDGLFNDVHRHLDFAERLTGFEAVLGQVAGPVEDMSHVLDFERLDSKLEKVIETAASSRFILILAPLRSLERFLQDYFFVFTDELMQLHVRCAFLYSLVRLIYHFFDTVTPPLRGLTLAKFTFSSSAKFGAGKETTLQAGARCGSSLFSIYGL